MSTITRAEHIRWAKDRALEYADAGDRANTVGSMASDVGKHPDTEGLVEIVFVTAIMAGDTPEQLRRWVEGFAE